MNISPTAERPVKVLVIDDVEDTAETLAEFLLQGYGFDARVAHASAVLVDGSHCWLLGCEFAQPLSDEDMQALA